MVLAVLLIAACTQPEPSPPSNAYTPAADTCTHSDSNTIADRHSHTNAYTNACFHTYGHGHRYAYAHPNAHTHPTPAPTPGPDAYLKSSYELQKMLIQVDRQGVRGPGKRGVIAAAGYADFDRDGDIDALMSPTRLSTSRTPMEFYRSGSVGTFIKDDSIFAGPVPGMVNARKMLVGDYNRDGWPDAFVIGTGFDAPPFPGEYPILLLSDGQGKLVSRPYTQVSSFQHGGASADIDHDGDLDIFVMSGNGTSYFLMNDGTGTFTYDSARVPSGGQDRFTAELVDVDGDGAFDLVTSGHDHEGSPAVIAWGDIDGEFSSDRQTTLPGVPCYGVAIDIEVEDLDGDGDRDIIVNRTSGGCGTF